MKKRSITRMAICYDFDGTLSPRYMQEYGFFLGLPEKERKTFFKQSNELARTKEADPILTYMQLMIKKAANSDAKLGTTRKDFKAYGKDIEFFPGVPTWFKRITEYAASKQVKLDHYIISSGLKEIVEGSKIGKCFKKIYACSFLHGVNDAAEWPAQVVNFTTKTQYLFRINKGSEDVSDVKQVNEYINPEDRPVPFSHMIYMGDGETDVPCMRLVKEQGGHSVAVYSPGKKKSHATALKLFKDGRVNYVVQADYSEGKLLDEIVKGIVDVVATKAQLHCLSRRAVPKISDAKKEIADLNMSDDSPTANGEARPSETLPAADVKAESNLKGEP